MQQPTQQSHNDHAKQGESDCQDCKKEREQNKLLVNMYEKLKHIEKKVERVQSTLKGHLTQTNNDASNVMAIGSKIQGYHGDEDTTATPAEIGLELAKQLIQRRENDKLEQENKELKEIIRKMRAEQAKQYEVTESMRKEVQDNGSRILIAERTVKIHNAKPIFNPQTQPLSISLDQPSHYLQSQSTQFIINKKEPKKNIIPELSLWLFDNIENTRLQSQLYSNRDRTTKNQSYFQKKQTSRASRYGQLPNIQRQSESRKKDPKLQSSRLELPSIRRRRSNQ